MHKVFLAVVCLMWTVCGAIAGPVTIAALGDSLVQGYGLAQGQGFVPQLQRWLEDKGAGGKDGIRVINAGVSGDTTAGGAARVDWTLAEGVDAMIVVLGGNDMLRGLDPAMSRANLDRILTVADNQGVAVLLVGMHAPGNFGPGYKTAFDRIYPDLAAKHDVLFHADFFGAFPDAARDPQTLSGYLQADGIHPNRAGVARIVDDIGPEVLTLIEQAR